MTMSAPCSTSRSTSSERLATVGRVLLVAAPVAATDDLDVDRVTEGAVERRGVLGRIGEDRRPRGDRRRRGPIGSRRPGRPSSRWAPRGRHPPRPGRRRRPGSAPRWRRCRPRRRSSSDAAVTVVGVLVQAEVRDQHELVAELADQAPERHLDDPVRVRGARADGVLGGGDAEEGDRA